MKSILKNLVIKKAEQEESQISKIFYLPVTEKRAHSASNSIIVRFMVSRIKTDRIIICIMLLFLPFVCGYSPAITSFNTGQVSPLMEERSEFPKYPSFCRTLENFLVLAQGPVTRRPGTKYIAAAKTANFILIPFEYATDDTYVIEAGDYYMRFYRDGGQILDSNSVVYEIVTPFSTNELANLRYAQANNIMYLVDGTDMPQQLTRTGHTSWTLTDANIITGPFRTENAEDINIVPSGDIYDINAVSSTLETFTIKGSGNLSSVFKVNKIFTVKDSNGNDGDWTVKRTDYNDPNFKITVTENITSTKIPYGKIDVIDQNITLKANSSTADANIFKAGHTGSIWEINQKRDISTVKGKFSYPGGEDWNSVSSPYFVGGYSFTTSGVWTGTVTLERSTNGGLTWSAALNSLSAINFDNPAETEEDGAIYRVIIEGIISGTCNYAFSITDQMNHGIVRINTVVETNAVAAVAATLTESYTDANANLIFKAVAAGAAGNNYTVRVAGQTTVPVIYIGVYGTDVNIFSKTSLPKTTANVIKTAFDACDAAKAMMSLTVGGNGNGNPTVKAKTNLTGGADGYNSLATATVIKPLIGSSSTKQWREGYWSPYRGYPKTVAFHQQRLVLGGSEFFPQTIWFGKTNPDDYTNFTEGTLDKDAFTMALPGQNPVQWLLSRDYLFIGTSSSVGKYGKSGEAITPTSPSYNEQSKSGSANINAVFANDSILYIERGANKLREFVYSLQSDKYLSPDLTVLSEDITKSGIKNIAFQMRPIPILWCVLNDGNMATFTFQRDQEIMSWSLQHTQGNFESVAVIPSGREDEVWVGVSRTIDNSTAYYIEQFQPLDWGADNNDCFFVDSGLGYNGSSTNQFGSLSHLNGKTVSVYADGIVCPDVTVSSGTITIANSASRVIVGLPYISKLETVPIVFNTPQGSSAPFNVKITGIDFDFYKSGFCRYGFGRYSELIPINFFSSDFLTTAKQPLYTSEDNFCYIKFPFGPKKKATIYLETDKPLPLTVRAIYPTVEAIP